MLMHPDVQKRAQEELDRVVGTDRLPTLDDRKNLPFVNAVIMEVMRLEQGFVIQSNILILMPTNLKFRWQPVAPLGELRKSIAIQFPH